MEYAGFLIRRKRLARNWSQEGLCRGICTVSHLSKIEQGKTRASREVLELLLERMDCRWMAVEDRHRAAVERAWDAYETDTLDEKLYPIKCLWGTPKWDGQKQSSSVPLGSVSGF